MAVELATHDLKTLTAAVKGLNAWANVWDRRRFLDSTFGSTNSAQRLIAQLNLDGPPDLVAGDVIVKLAKYGRIEFGRPALGVFLNAVIETKGQGESTDIREVIHRHNIDGVIASERPVKTWKGTNPGLVQEKIIGENTVFPLWVLERAIVASRSVAHLTVQDVRSGKTWYGTGFLITKSLLMTNEHVVQSREALSGTTITFGHDLGVNGEPLRSADVLPRTDGLFFANPDLDYAVLELTQASAALPLQLDRTRPEPGDPISVILHPRGHIKQVSIRNNAVQHSDKQVIQYTTSTVSGASGAPLLEHRSFRAVGVHHGGGQLIDPSSNVPCYRNEATTIDAILDDLKGAAPNIYEEWLTSHESGGNQGSERLRRDQEEAGP